MLTAGEAKLIINEVSDMGRILRTTSWTIFLAAACRASGAERQPVTAVELQVGGGNNPGRYTALVKAPGCARDLTGTGSWGVQLSDWTGEKSGLRSLQLVIPAADRPDQFYVGIVFGDFFAGTVHEIETRAEIPLQRGHGMVRVTDAPSGARITLTGMTADSVALMATIACAAAQATQERKS